MPITVPSVGTPILQTWGKAVADELNTQGLKGRSLITASQGGLSSTRSDITGLSVTFTAALNRWYRVIANLNISLASSPGVAIAVLLDGSTDLINAQHTLSGASVTLVATCRPEIVTQFAAGSHTIKVQASTAGPSGSVTASAASPAWVTVEDIGPV